MLGDQNRYALITGASSGIGYELARLFAQKGKKLVLVSRNMRKLEDVRQELEKKYRTSAVVIPKDLSNSEAPREIFSKLTDEGVNIDVLVNNAGFGVLGRFSETDLQRELDLIQVFVASLTHMTKLFLKNMLEEKSGWIMNLSSGLGLLPVPLFAVYAACESYVLHFTEALANELRGTGVSVTCLCPGPTATAFFKRANVEKTKYGHWKMMDPVYVAKSGYSALSQGKPVAMPGFRNMSLAFLARTLPRSMATKLTRLIMEDALREAPTKFG